ncbi:SusC/RagA family TonB-linked outer membrane protein [Dyadobacter psychrotolerans]|nr:TonB-dependent receptor [Dyadobacter psychrotolerans]
MKRSLLQLSLAVICSGVCFAHAMNAQSVLNRSVKIRIVDKSFDKALAAIEKKANVKFAFRSTLTKPENNFTVESQGEPLSGILDRFLTPLKISYEVSGEHIVLRKKNLSQTQTSAAEIAERDLAGTIVDEKGEVLPGVSVIVKGTQRGTISDANGKYAISLPEGSVSLVFSFVGYLNQEVAVSNQTVLDVTLKGDTKALEEVIVVGYGTQKKRDVSTAISSVSSKELKDKPVANFATAMVGKMAGVKISNSNTAPGGGTTIRIRGVSSINATNNPLIVIDGFPLKDGFNKDENPLNGINVADIESIEVLKDASSSAIYGTQAANGVILITTKKGKKGKPTLSINASRGFDQMINKVDVLHGDAFLQYLDDARANAYIIEDPNFGTNNLDAPQWKWTDSPALRIENWKKYSSNAAGMAAPGNLFARWITVSDTIYKMPYDTDWQDLITRTGSVYDVQLSASGGSDNVNYMISGGYYNQKGIVLNSDYNRVSFRANIDLKLTNRIRAGLLLAPTLENSNVLPNIEGGTNNNPFYNAVAMPPIWNATDASGEPVFYGNTLLDPWDWNFAFFVNPLHLFKKKDSRRNFKNLSTIYTEIDIVKGLKFRSEFHTEYRYRERDYFNPSSVPTASATFSRSQGINETNNRLYWNSQNFLTYQKEFGKHSVSAVAGYSVEESNYRDSYMVKYDYPTDLMPTLNQAITILNAQTDARTNRSSDAMIGSFGRVMYNFAGKYYLTGSIRRDGSSKFGQEKKWGVFPSVSAAWRISDEPFFKPLQRYINDMKIRGGYGIIGNSGINNYLALSTLNSSSYVLGAGSAVSPSYTEGKIANPELGWEETSDIGAGIDAELLNNRISLTVDYFHRHTRNMLFSMPLPVITGFANYMANIGAMRNRGFEYSITTRNLVGTLKWTTNANLSYYRNRVLDIGKDKRPLLNNDGYTTEGRPIAGIWGASFLGPYKDWEDVKTSPIVNANNPDWRYRSSPGTAKLADVNGDGIIDASDNTIVGSAIPDFTWGMTNNFEYKGIDLTVQINGTQGGDISMRQMEGIYGRGTGQNNTTVDYYNNYWTPTNTDAKYTAPSRKSYDGTNMSGSLLYKGTFVNIQNIALGYTLPQPIVARLKMSRVRLYTTVINAWFITKFPGYNPEANAQGDNALSQGINRDSYPMSRSISFGANLSF